MIMTIYTYIIIDIIIVNIIICIVTNMIMNISGTVIFIMTILIPAAVFSIITLWI